MGRFKNRIGDLLSIVNRKKINENLIDDFLSYNILWPITSPVWNKNFFLKIGGFDYNLSRFQDFDIHIRALQNKPKITLYPHNKIDCYYRNSLFHQTLTDDKKRIILNDALYLMKKYEKISIKFMPGFYAYLLKRYKNIMNKNELTMIKNIIK